MFSKILENHIELERDGGWGGGSDFLENFPKFCSIAKKGGLILEGECTFRYFRKRGGIVLGNL